MPLQPIEGTPGLKGTVCKEGTRQGHGDWPLPLTIFTTCTPCYTAALAYPDAVDARAPRGRAGLFGGLTYPVLHDGTVRNSAPKGQLLRLTAPQPPSLGLEVAQRTHAL